MARLSLGVIQLRVIDSGIEVDVAALKAAPLLPPFPSPCCCCSSGIFLSCCCCYIKAGEFVNSPTSSTEITISESATHVQITVKLFTNTNTNTSATHANTLQTTIDSRQKKNLA